MPNTYPQLNLAFNLKPMRIVGRHRHVNNAIEYSWPAVFFEVKFRGTAIAFKFRDFSNNYNVYIDGAMVYTLESPGTQSHVISGLDDDIHTIKISKVTDWFEHFRKHRFLHKTSPTRPD